MSVTAVFYRMNTKLVKILFLTLFLCREPHKLKTPVKNPYTREQNLHSYAV